MSFNEIIADCSVYPTKHTNTLCEQKAELVCVALGGTYSYQWAMKCYISHSDDYSGVIL
jgi:hypothetical protein